MRDLGGARFQVLAGDTKKLLEQCVTRVFGAKNCYEGNPTYVHSRDDISKFLLSSMAACMFSNRCNSKV